MTERIPLTSVEALPPGEGATFSVDGDGIALFNVDGEFRAIGDRCPHAGGSLGRGTLVNGTVKCPLHGARFDVSNGEVKRPPAEEPVRRYDVKVEDGQVYLIR